MPVLFISMKNYSESKTLFDNAIYEIAENDVDELFHSKNSYTSHDRRIGEYCFCKAIIVDLAESEDKCRNNQPQKNKNQLSSTLSSTVCLLHTLFEDLGCGMVPAWVGQNITPLTSSLGIFVPFFTYNELVSSRVHPQQHKQPTNTTTIVMEVLAPPAAWI